MAFNEADVLRGLLYKLGTVTPADTLLDLTLKTIKDEYVRGHHDGIDAGELDIANFVREWFNANRTPQATHTETENKLMPALYARVPNCAPF